MSPYGLAFMSNEWSDTLDKLEAAETRLYAELGYDGVQQRKRTERDLHESLCDAGFKVWSNKRGMYIHSKNREYKMHVCVIADGFAICHSEDVDDQKVVKTIGKVVEEMKTRDLEVR